MKVVIVWECLLLCLMTAGYVIDHTNTILFCGIWVIVINQIMRD